MGEGNELKGGPTGVRARAKRYRSLAESLSSPEMVAAALECAGDLEREADLEEQAGIAGAVRAA
jgi:hypothetical protein